MITVISTGLGPAGCAESVLTQIGVTVDFRVVDASKQNPRLTKLENVAQIVRSLPPWRIVAMVDSDDRLARGDALAIVERAHDTGAWVTYGSFRYSDGRPGFAAELKGAVRQRPWVTTHLKTFRAGLFQRICGDDFQYPRGLPIENADDHAFMMPMVEMAAERAVFVREVVYEYNLQTSGEWTMTDGELKVEREAAEYIRSLQPYTRLSVQPW